MSLLAVAVYWIVLFTSFDSQGASLSDEVPHLLHAIEGSELVLVGKVASADFVVERALVGERARGNRVSLSESHGLAQGERVLVALVPRADRGYGVDASLRRPAQDTLRTLQRYLTMDPGVRSSARGIGELIRLADAPNQELALAAISRLADTPGLASLLAPVAAGRILNALDRRKKPVLREAVLELIEARKLTVLAAPLRARIAESAPPAPVYYEALARLEGGLSGKLLDELLENEHPDYRALGARFASGPAVDELLPILALEDPFPRVRVAAVVRLSTVSGRKARDTFEAASRDENLEVRAAALRAVAALSP